MNEDKKKALYTALGATPDEKRYAVYTEAERYAAWRQYIVEDLRCISFDTMLQYTTLRRELLYKIAYLCNAFELEERWTEEEVSEVFAALIGPRLEECLRSIYCSLSEEYKCLYSLGQYQTSTTIDGIEYHIFLQ